MELIGGPVCMECAQKLCMQQFKGLGPNPYEPEFEKPTAEDIDLATLAELPPELQDELRAQMAAERASRRKRSAARPPAPGGIRAFLKPRT